MLADATRMRTDLVAEAILLLGDVAGLFQQRQVDVAFGVALSAWISTPVPGAAEVAAFLNDANILDPGPRRRAAAKRPPKPPPTITTSTMSDRGLRVKVNVRIVDIVADIGGDLDVLVIGVGAQPPIALVAVLLAQGIGIEVEVLAQWAALPLILGTSRAHAADRF